MLRKGSHLAALVLLVAGGSVMLTGCAKKTEESMTTVDSTLTGGLSSDVPEPGPTPSTDYTNPPASTSPPASKPKPKPPSSGSSSGSSSSSSSASRVTVPAGTDLEISLVSDLNTKTTTAGSPISATVADDVVVNGVVVIPAGAEVTGHVVTASRSGKASGRAYMQLAFDEVSFGGKSYNIEAATDTMFGKGGSGKDAAMIGGGAVAGAILGKVLGGSGGSAAKGAVVGGAAGTAASLLTRGPDLHLEPGKKVTVSLDSPVSVTKPKVGA